MTLSTSDGWTSDANSCLGVGNVVRPAGTSTAFSAAWGGFSLPNAFPDAGDVLVYTVQVLTGLGGDASESALSPLTPPLATKESWFDFDLEDLTQGDVLFVCVTASDASGTSSPRVCSASVLLSPTQLVCVR